MVFIELRDQVSDYQEAILLTCEVLRQNGIVDERYYPAILDGIRTYGGYFYLGDGICMPHARAEDGVLRPGVCLLSLREPVDFLGKAVRLFFTLAAMDSQQHIGLIKNISNICSSQNAIHALLEAGDETELRQLWEETYEKNMDDL